MSIDKKTYKTQQAELVNRLKTLGAFWSYQSDGLEKIPENIIIEEALRWGDVSEIILLFELYPFEQIKIQWNEKLIPDERIYAHNYYLASIFFDIDKPKEYILPLQKKYSRYERIKEFIA